MSENVMVGAAVEVGAEQCRLQRVSFDSSNGSLVNEWKALEAGRGSDSPMQDPTWLEGYFSDELQDISTYLFHQSGSLLGAVPFLLKDWPIQLHIGEIPFGHLPLRRLRLLGDTLNFGEDEAMYDLLFRELATGRNDYDSLYFSQIPVESYLWRYLNESPMVTRCFHRYIPEERSLHPRIRVSGSFEEYMKKFNKTHRHTLRRKVSRFQEEAPGEMRFVRYTRPEEVAPFLDSAVAVSKKTYQWNLHQRGLRKTDLIRKRLLFAAQHGWFRSYLLFCGDTPYAFLSGYQWKGRYYTDEIGFDPVLAKRSPGTVLQMLTIQDLLTNDPPEWIDFGSYDKYKEEFSNDNYDHCSMFLFRRNFYTRVVRAGDASSRFITRTGSKVLSRWQLKARFKKAIRGLSVKSE